jgi:hypothetical protein
MRGKAWVLLPFAVGLVIAAFVALRLNRASEAPPGTPSTHATILVPSVVGETLAEAKQTLQGLQLEMDFRAGADPLPLRF